jgi:hypothetical protein
MKQIRVFASVSLLLAVAGACIGESGPLGTNGGSTGTFSITITEFANGPTNGAATFELERSGEGATFSMSFVDSLGFSALLTGPGTPIVGEDRAIGEEEGLVTGILTRPGPSGPEVYVLTTGSVTFAGVSANRLIGAIEFTAVQREGPAVGSTISGNGNFTATGRNSQK